MRRLFAVLVVLSLTTLMVVGQDPDELDDVPPVRLKKKPRKDDKKPMKEKVDPKDDVKTKLKQPKDKGKEPITEPGGEPAAPQENVEEVLARIRKNMVRVQEHLEKERLDEGTLQTEDDIIADLEALIHRKENEQSNNAQQNPQGGQAQQGQQGDQKNRLTRSQRNRGRGQSGGRNRDKGRGQGQPQMAKNNPGQDQGKQGKPKSASGQGQQDQPKPGKGGDTPGAGNTPPGEQLIHRTDLYKEVWGHLPATMRPKMDANPGREAYMMKYRDLIERYYQSVSKQGGK